MKNGQWTDELDLIASPAMSSNGMLTNNTAEAAIW